MTSRHRTDTPRRGDTVWYGKRLFEDKKEPNGTIFKTVWNDGVFEEAWVVFSDHGIECIPSEQFVGSFASEIWRISYHKEHPALGTVKLEDGELKPIPGVKVPDSE